MKAEFFFDKKVSTHVNDIHMKAITKRSIEREMKAATGEDLDKLRRELSEIEKWFSGQITPTHRKFKKHLKLR